MLIIVEDGDVEHLLKTTLDLEALRRFDVLEVDPAEGRGESSADRHHLIDGRRLNAHRVGVDISELLEEHRLALHHRHRRLRSDVAKAKHRGAIRQHRDGIRTSGQVPHTRRLLGDGRRHPADPRGVGHGEIVGAVERRGRLHPDLPGLVQGEGRVLQ